MITEIIILAGAVVTILLILWIVFGNVVPEIKTINVSSDSLPRAFDGFRIVQISDLHNTEFGKNNCRLISLLKKAKADIFVITGDIIYSRKPDIEKALFFAERARKIAPVYYVNGNHESRLGNAEYKTLTSGLVHVGVTVLENKTSDISVGDENVTLVGISDPCFSAVNSNDNFETEIEHRIEGLVRGNDNYKVLLAHRPEYFETYAGKVNLVMSGHAHGGQVILPFAGGLFAPGQGVFPKYYDGLYKGASTDMIVSRGIGKSLFPFRINNRPTVVVAELRSVGKKFA